MPRKRNLARERAILGLYLRGEPVDQIPASPAYLSAIRKRYGIAARPRPRSEVRREAKAYPAVRYCSACPSPIPRHPLDTDRTYASRDVCSRACDRKVKGTQAERGALRWRREEQGARI